MEIILHGQKASANEVLLSSPEYAKSMSYAHGQTISVAKSMDQTNGSALIEELELIFKKLDILSEDLVFQRKETTDKFVRLETQKFRHIAGDISDLQHAGGFVDYAGQRIDEFGQALATGRNMWNRDGAHKNILELVQDLEDAYYGAVTARLCFC